MKKSIIIALTLIFVLALSACNQQVADNIEAGDNPGILENTADPSRAEGNQDVDAPTSKSPISPTEDHNQSNSEHTESSVAVSDPVQKTSTDKPTASVSYLSRVKAIEIALKKAGFKQSEVHDLDAELDRENGGVYWEVEFEVKGREYDYKIEAINATLKSQSSKNVQYISRNRAIEIALQEAGVKKSDVRDLDAELDRERDIAVWEVDFEVGNREYEYEINAKTAAILKHDANTVYISSDRAIEVALKKAGLKKADVRELQVELDDDQKLVVYEVEFKAKGYEYSYEINAVSGKILRAEREKDD